MVYQPEEIINRYVWEQFRTKASAFYNQYAQTSGGPETIPFFPSPASNVPSWVINEGKPYIIFDKFTRVRNNRQLHSIKTDQMRYTVVGGFLDTSQYPQINQRDRYGLTIDFTSLIHRILDRDDDTARDINQFAATLPGYAESNEMYKYYFHNFSVYQSGFTDTQMDVDNFMEYEPKRDLIIRYDYHFAQMNERPNV
jgi:hypothetical protein